MISFSPSQRYFLFGPRTDMRRGFDRLGALVAGQAGLDVMSGDVFIFINRQRNRVKLLVWDRSGFVICYKRLEEGTFELPVAEGGGAQAEIRWEELVLILEGISRCRVRGSGRRCGCRICPKPVQ